MRRGDFLQQYEENVPSEYGVLRDEDKPWKTNLARQSALRRQRVQEEIETAIKKAGSFEEALHGSAELMKKRFARFSAITAYVADGEDLVVHTSLDRPEGPDRVWSGGGPLAEAAKGDKTTLVSDAWRSGTRPWPSTCAA